MSEAVLDVQLRLPVQPGSVASARRFVSGALGDAGLGDVVGEAELAVSELAANVVLHARTEMVVRVKVYPRTARVCVSDDSPRLPVAPPVSLDRLSGRGLSLVTAVTSAWGVRPNPPGKSVWFTVDITGDEESAGAGVAAAPHRTAPNPEDILASWPDLDDIAASPPAGRVVRVLIEDLPTAEMAAAKDRIEDLTRDLRLVLLHHETTREDPGPAGPAADDSAAQDDVQVARRLDAAAQGFAAARDMMRRQVAAAVLAGRAQVTLVLDLSTTAASAAAEYLAALDDADELARRGRLLLAEPLTPHMELRRRYLREIIRQLQNA